jgi:hypothetical protein
MYKTALVTGAASGLGFELALLLAKDNYNLYLIDIDAGNLKSAQEEIKSISKASVFTVVKDLSKPNSALEIVNELKHPIDILINNAGFGLFGAFYETNWEREAQMLHLHVITTTHLTKLILKGMMERGSGKILNVSSLAAFQPGPLMALYYASKAYILSFSEAIANELKDTGITVTALCPGQTNTSFQDVVSNSTSENKINFNMAEAKDVALYGYMAMHKGKTLAIPGVINKFLSKLHRFVSRKMATRIVRKIQEKNRED